MANNNYDFNFEWSSKPKEPITGGGSTPAENLNFEALTAIMLKTRVAGESFKLFVSGKDVAYFEIENVTSVDLVGSNIILYFGNLTNTTVLKFIDNSEAIAAEARLEIILNGGTVS